MHSYSAQQSIKQHESCKEQDGKRNTGIPLSDCLDLFTAKKTVGKENAWYISIYDNNTLIDLPAKYSQL